MYIKKADRKLFQELDNYLEIPKGFYKFVDKITKTHNLIIKKGTNYHCTNCNCNFEDKKVKLNRKLKCPNCKNSYTVKSTNLKHFEFADCLGLLDRYKDYWIIRYFEVISNYNSREFHRDLCEYGRKIYNSYFREEYEIINDHTLTGIGYCTVRHSGYIETSNWRYFTSYWKGLGDNLIFYPGNMKNIFKNSQYQYSQMWELAKHKKYFDLSTLLHLYDGSYEFLIKLKLYNLVGTENFRGRNFNEIFGVDKCFLPFMQRFHINHSELEVLRFYKKENIKVIRYFSDVDMPYSYSNNVDLDLLLEKTNYSKVISHEYEDYLRFCKELGYNLKDKKILYPSNISKAHDKVLKLIKTKKNKSIQNKILKRYKEISKNIFENEKFKIFPTKSISELIEESRQQNNCVKTYAEKIANGDCDIYFMRLKENPIKSLVTVEVRNNKIVQKRTKNNNQTTSTQNKFLKLWEEKVLGEN